MRTWIPVAGLLIALTACSSGETDDEAEAPEPSATSTSTSTPEAPETTTSEPTETVSEAPALETAEACSQLPVELPDAMDLVADPALGDEPSATFRDLGGRMSDMAAGRTVVSVGTAISIIPFSEGASALDARAEYRDAVSAVSELCGAAGVELYR